MASELSPIDIARIPELAQLVDEVAATGKRRRIVRDGQDVAVLAPAKTGDAARERRFRRMLAVAQRNPEVDGDALLDELERDDAERRARA